MRESSQHAGSGSCTPRRYALLGAPVKHSVSPQMQAAAFRELGIQATYELLEVAPPALGETVARLRRHGFAGWNVTVPHKEAVLDFLDDAEAAAAAAGSVNTVRNDGGRLTGFSTDGYGLAAALAESFDVPLAGRSFGFLGTGGAARAASVFFALHGAGALVLANRTLVKANAIAAIIRAVAPACRVSVVPLAETTRLAAALETVDVIIQGTSLGLHAGDPLPVAAEVLPGRAAVLDMIYRDTPFLEQARNRGCRTADGRGMLLFQGARSLEIWTGHPAPVEVMRGALAVALAAREA